MSFPKDEISVRRRVLVKRREELSYREHLKKAAKKHPVIYEEYSKRANPGVLDNAWNPLGVGKRHE